MIVRLQQNLLVVTDESEQERESLLLWGGEVDGYAGQSFYNTRRPEPRCWGQANDPKGNHGGYLDAHLISAAAPD